MKQSALTNRPISNWCGGEDPAAALENSKSERRLIKQY
jgi:hypothetical protein